MYGKCAETDEQVVGWVKEALTKYERGDFGEWDVYYYTPRGGSNIQPMVVSMPDETQIPKEGWIKLKKTDLSGNNLSGATFGVYTDAGCQNEVHSFTTTADEWTYVDVSEFMTDDTQTFYVKETSAPPGYVGSTKPYQVTVSSTNNKTKETAAAVNGGAPIKNGEPQTPTGIVNKVDQDGNGVGPATFHFKSLTNGIETDRVCDETGTLELQWDDPDGENYLKPGGYTVTEKLPLLGMSCLMRSRIFGSGLKMWMECLLLSTAALSFSRISPSTPSSSRRWTRMATAFLAPCLMSTSMEPRSTVSPPAAMAPLPTPVLTAMVWSLGPTILSRLRPLMAT